MDQIENLSKNKWIRKCDGSWVSIIVLAAKSRQEKVNSIKKYVWMVCVSYRGLNKVTNLYKYHIPWCGMGIMIFQIGSAGSYFITVDTKHG